MKQPIAYFIVQDKTVFMPLKFLYSECFYHIEKLDQVYPMRCFVDNCPVTANCGEILARRTNYLFERLFPQAEMLIAYYKYPDRPRSIRAIILNEDFSDPRVVTLNPWAFKKFQKEGIPYKWFPTEEYSFMSGSKGLLPVESLLRGA